MIIQRLLLPLVALIAVAGCGGGDSSNGGPPPPPPQNGMEPGDRGRDIRQRADSFLSTTFYAETDHPDLPTVVVPMSCSGTSCSGLLPGTDEVDDYDLAGLGIEDEVDTLLATRNGVAVLFGAWTENNGASSFRGWGGWMEHSAFEVETGTTVEDIDGANTRISFRYGMAGGDLTGSAPTGSATWRGVMIGTPATGDRKDNRLVGDAALTFDLTATTLDAVFTSIVDMDRAGAPHSVASVQFSDVPVSGSGEYSAGSTGDRISGGFSGPNHAETAGVFEQSNIVGAFGAKQQ